MYENQSKQDDAELKIPKVGFFKKNKLAIIAVVCLLILGVGGYFGYQIYQTNQYIERVSPIYRNCEAQGVQLTEMFNNGGLYKNLIADTDKIGSQLKDLKVRLAEINTTTSKSTIINRETNNLIDIQIKRAQEQNSMYSNGLSAKMQENIIESLNSNNMLRIYVSEQINKSKMDKLDAEIKRDASKNKLRDYITEYKEKNKIVALYFGVKLDTEPEKPQK